MRKVYDRFIVVLQVCAGVLCLLMASIVLVGLFYRYVIDEALSWYDEFAGFTLVWLTMYGSVVALAKRKHISFETLVEKLSPRRQQVVAIVVNLLEMSFSAVLLVYGWELIREMADETAISIPSVKMAWIYSVMPICGALMLIIGIVQLIGSIQALRRGGTGGAPAVSRGMQEAQ